MVKGDKQQHRGAKRGGSNSSRRSTDNTPCTSTPSKPVKPADKSLSIDASSDRGQLPSLNSDHREKGSCPCNKSVASWKIDCSKCHQYWHIDCLSMKGLNEAAINSMSSFLCPFCFVSPVPTIQTTVDVCHICRNTLTLQQSNSQYEASLAAKKIQNVSKCCKMLEGIDFEEFNSRLDTLSQFDQRLRHILLNENSLKGLDSDIRSLTEVLTSASDTPPSSNTALTEMSKTIQTYDDSFQAINNNIVKLQNDLQLLSSIVPCLNRDTHPNKGHFT